MKYRHEAADSKTTCYSLEWIQIASGENICLFQGCVFYPQKKVEMNRANVWLTLGPGGCVFLLLIPLCLILLNYLCFFARLTAIWGELQPQLFFLELLQENHDWLLVNTGLPIAGHQPDTHHMLLYASNQLCSPHGACGCQGRRCLFFFPFLASKWSH